MTGPAAAGPPGRPVLVDRVEARRGDYEARLQELVEIPSVSADPERRDDIDRAARAAAGAIRRLGGEAEIRTTAGHPVVIGALGDDPGAPTVAFYSHLDVQPASRRDEPWETEPFVFVRRGERYFGRGTTDDKGPALATLFGASLARQAGAAANVRFVWELEEEIGSPHLDAGLAGAGLRPDLLVVSDTGWLSADRPAAPAGLRGFVGFRFELETAGSDRHSGDVGGAARNPVAELASLIAEMHDARTGEVRIPGFHDDVLPLRPEEIDEFRRSGFDLATYRTDNDLWLMRTEDPVEVMKRIWGSPTFEVHGIAGGYSGPGVKAIVPRRAEALVSCRLVPDQRPERIADHVARFVRARNRDVRVSSFGGSLPYRGVTSGPHAEMLREAVRSGYRRELAFIRDGGTIGAVTTLAARYRCPVLFLGMSLPSHGYHAPNENFDWGQASGGIRSAARLVQLAAERLAAPRPVPGTDPPP